MSKDDDVWRDGLVRERNVYMLEHDIDTDCTFIVGLENTQTREFQAHRLLLRNTSVVFHKMLTGEMVEAKTGHVRVTDLSPNTFQLLLRFIYADEVKMATFDEACDVAYAADKYLMKKLFHECLSSMCKFLTAENVWKALKFTKLLPHELLREKCIKVIQEETKKCVEAQDFVQAMEKDVALLLEQDVLNVEDELELVDATVKWATHEAERRGLRGDISSVRVVLLPCLMSLLRLLTIPPTLFAQTFQHSNLLTTDEKWAIMVCMHTGNCDELPLYLSARLVARKRSSAIFYCQRQVLGPLDSVKGNGKIFDAVLVFHVNCDVELKLLGFQIPSIELEDETKLGSTEMSYDGNISVVVESCGRSLLPFLVEFENLLNFEFEESVAYNSTIDVMFPQPVVLKKDNWFKIAVALKNYGNYPNAQLEAKMVCQDVPIEVEFEVNVGEHRNRLRSFNDGLFRALIFSL